MKLGRVASFGKTSVFSEKSMEVSSPNSRCVLYFYANVRSPGVRIEWKVPDFFCSLQNFSVLGFAFVTKVNSQSFAGTE